MKEEIKSGGPVQEKQSVFSPLALAIMAVLFGLVMPPLGVLIAAFALYQAGKKSSKWALWLSLLAIVAAAVSSGFYWHQYQARRTNVNNHTFTYTAFETAKLTGSGKKHGMTFSKPTAFKEQAGFHNTSDSAVYAHRVLVPGYKNGVYASTIIVSDGQYPVLKGIPTYINQVDAVMQKGAGPKNGAYQAYSGSLRNFLYTGVVTGTKIALVGKAQPFTNPSIKQHAWVFDYASTLTYLDGSKAGYKGKVVLIQTPSRQYYFSISGLNNTWKANASSWQNILNSIKVDQ